MRKNTTLLKNLVDWFQLLESERQQLKEGQPINAGAIDKQKDKLLQQFVVDAVGSFQNVLLGKVSYRYPEDTHEFTEQVRIWGANNKRKKQDILLIKSPLGQDQWLAYSSHSEFQFARIEINKQSSLAKALNKLGSQEALWENGMPTIPSKEIREEVKQNLIHWLAVKDRFQFSLLSKQYYGQDLYENYLYPSIEQEIATLQLSDDEKAHFVDYLQQLQTIINDFSEDQLEANSAKIAKQSELSQMHQFASYDQAVFADKKQGMGRKYSKKERYEIAEIKKIEESLSKSAHDVRKLQDTLRAISDYVPRDLEQDKVFEGSSDSLERSSNSEAVFWQQQEPKITKSLLTAIDKDPNQMAAKTLEEYFTKLKQQREQKREHSTMRWRVSVGALVGAMVGAIGFAVGSIPGLVLGMLLGYRSAKRKIDREQRAYEMDARKVSDKPEIPKKNWYGRLFSPLKKDQAAEFTAALSAIPTAA